MRKFLLHFFILVAFSAPLIYGQEAPVEVFGGESYTTNTFVGLSTGHRSNLFQASDGGLHLTVVDNYKLRYYQSSDNGTTWTQHELATEYNGKVSDVMIKGDDQGNLYIAVEVRPGYNGGGAIAYSDYFWRNLYLYHNLSGEWEKEPVETGKPSMGGYALRDLVVPQPGEVHLSAVYSGWWDKGGKGYEYRRDAETGSWERITVAEYSDAPVDNGMGYFQLAAGNAGTINGVYSRSRGSGNRELAARTLINGTWSDPVVIASNALYTFGLYSHPDGSPRLVYATNTTPQTVMYKTSLDNSPGEAIFSVPDGQTLQALAIHVNSYGKETLIINLNEQPALFAEKRPGDDNWPAALSPLPHGENVYSPSVINAPWQSFTNFAFTFVDFNPGTGTGPHGPNARYFYSIPDVWELSLSAVPSQGGTVSGAGTWEHGTPVTVSAVPAEGYAFKHWESDNTVLSTGADYTFELTSDSALTAHFVPVHHLEIVIAGSGQVVVADEGGQVIAPEAGEGNKYLVTDQAAVVLTATPGNGFLFAEWLEGGISQGSDNPLTLTVTQGRTITGTFEEETFEVTFSVLKDDQPVAGAQIYIEGVAQPIVTNASGTASCVLPNETYAYQVYSEGVLVVENGEIWVNGEALTEVVAWSTTGVNAPAEEAVALIYPNPFQNKIFIDDAGAIATIMVNDAGGQLVRTIHEPGHSLPLQELKPGLYLITIKFKTGQSSTRRMIKVR